MKEIQINGFSINYDTVQTKHCSVMLDEQLYIEDKKLPRYFIGETTMTFFDFYRADCPDFEETDYQLSEKFQQIIGRFPHTNQKKIALNGSDSYSIKQVPIYVTTKDYILAESKPEAYEPFREKVLTIQSLTPINEDEVGSVVGYKRKRLFLDGTYGFRELLEKGQEKNVQAIQEQLEYVNEMYYFAHYSYAAMIRFLPEYDITTYDKFHEAYGRFVYSFTMTKNGKTIPLLWPDYLYHKPENHLEFGLLANTGQPRYQVFDQWEANEPILIEILADGFEDVQFETHLKHPLNHPPKLSKLDYILGETVCLSIDPGVVKELEKQEAKFELFKTKKTSENGYSLDYELLKDQLLMPSAQFEKTGRYQLKITSDVYGQLLFLFTIKQEG